MKRCDQESDGGPGSWRSSPWRYRWLRGRWSRPRAEPRFAIRLHRQAGACGKELTTCSVGVAGRWQTGCTSRPRPPPGPTSQAADHQHVIARSRASATRSRTSAARSRASAMWIRSSAARSRSSASCSRWSVTRSRVPSARSASRARASAARTRASSSALAAIRSRWASWTTSSATSANLRVRPSPHPQPKERLVQGAPLGGRQHPLGLLDPERLAAGAATRGLARQPACELPKVTGRPGQGRAQRCAGRPSADRAGLLLLVVSCRCILYYA